MAGRPAKYVTDENGRVIEGLSVLRDGNRCRYYATHSQPRKWFGQDLQVAVQRFRTWKGEIPEPEISEPEIPWGVNSEEEEEEAERRDRETGDS